MLENHNIYEEAKGLLNILDILSKPANEDAEKNQALEKKILSNEFNIINLYEANQLVNSASELNIQERRSNDSKSGLSIKLLEIFVKYPVFYNTSLLPNAKYKYKSHFKRSNFSETEKM